jgi:hypothetical protein
LWGRRQGWGLNTRLCKAGALPLEPYLQFILLWLFCKWSLEIFAQADLEDHPNLSLQSSVFQVARITDISHQGPVWAYVLFLLDG